MGKTNLLERVLVTFVSQVGADLELLQRAIANSDVSEIASLAHRMRGTSLSVSATEFAVIALALEDVAESASLEELRRLTVQLQDEYRRIYDFVGSQERELTRC
jgi:HPt (histidine-containing phosphotransfer) domain-containing protein